MEYFKNKNVYDLKCWNEVHSNEIYSISNNDSSVLIFAESFKFKFLELLCCPLMRHRCSSKWNGPEALNTQCNVTQFTMMSQSTFCTLPATICRPFYGKMRLSDHYFHDSSGSFTRAVVSQQIVDELKPKFKLRCPGMAGRELPQNKSLYSCSSMKRMAR